VQGSGGGTGGGEAEPGGGADGSRSAEATWSACGRGAGAANVGFTVNVLDTVTSHSVTYRNLDQTTAAPVQDTSALPCR